MKTIISEFKTKDMLIRYNSDNKRKDCPPELMLIPLGMENLIADHREDIGGQPEAWFFKKWGAYPVAASIAPLVQICCSGDDFAGGFSQGISMQNSSSTSGLKFINQNTIKEGEYLIVRTEMSAPRSLSVFHELTFSEQSSYISIRSSCKNDGKSPVTIESLSSFTLGMITPFAEADAPERLRLHRFRSGWSAEGRHCHDFLENLGLTPSWSNHAVRSERFGQTGSMPVHKWFPFAAAEDTQAGVFWAVQLDAPASWQIEAFRQDDFLHLSGGCADREFGHWSKRVDPGESFTTLPAVLTTVKGTLEDACSRLLERQQSETKAPPAKSQDCPILFNEWCTSWGQPEAGKIIRSLPLLKEIGVKYYIIDAGWYADADGKWDNSMGDWNVSAELFPQGLGEVTEALRSQGIIPGLWFEFETAGTTSEISGRSEFLLKRDGVPVKSGERYFLDFCREDVLDYLRTRVIKLLKTENFGYIKIDYNETIGTGCDSGDDFPADGLTKQINCVQQFINEIRSEIPGIVIENCSSGGHRAEPSFINITDLTSFSDAHETVDIPIIAANLNRLVLPVKCLVWAVLHPEDSFKRLYYSLSSTFLGRMCLSGEIDQLNRDQLGIIKTAAEIYQRSAEMIDSLNIYRFGPEIRNWRHPRGWQAVLKLSTGKNRAFIVVHGFQHVPSPLKIELSQLNGNWKTDEIFSLNKVEISANILTITDFEDFSGMVVFLHRE